MIVSVYIIYINRFERHGIKTISVKLTIFLLLLLSTVNTIAHNYGTVVEKFSFSELTIEKVKFFTQSPTNIFCISIFNARGCLASCLTLVICNFRPSVSWLLTKKKSV